MDQVTLVEEWKEAGKEFLDEFAKTYPVKVAVWVKETEDSPWYLYVASDKIDAREIEAGYTEALRSAKRLHTYFDPLRVKIVPLDDPIANDVARIKAAHPGPFGTYYGGSHLGNISIEGAYIYPSALAISS